MASKDVAPLLAREFVFVKIDYDRAKGAKEIEKRYIDKEQGLPWFVFLDGDGKALIHSTGPKGRTPGSRRSPRKSRTSRRCSRR